VIDIFKTLKIAYEGGLVRGLGKKHAIAGTCKLYNRKSRIIMPTIRVVEDLVKNAPLGWLNKPWHIHTKASMPLCKGKMRLSMYSYKKLRCLVKEKVHSSIHSTLNTTVYIRMAGGCVLAFLCKCIQSNKNTSDKKSGPREFRNQSLRKLQWICSTSRCRVKSKVKHVSLRAKKHSSLF